MTEEVHYTYYEAVRGLEEQIVHAVVAKHGKNLEEYTAGYEFGIGFARNTAEFITMFIDFLQESSAMPLTLRVLPVFEITWLLGSLSADNYAMEKATTVLLNKIDQITEGDVGELYRRGVFSKNMLSKTCLQRWVHLAQLGKELTGLRSDRYKKLLNMLATLSRVNKIPLSMWNELIRDMFPVLSPSILGGGDAMENRSAIIADIGTPDTSVFMPFMVMNSPAVLKLILNNFENSVNGGPVRLSRSIGISIPHAMASLLVTAKYSKAGTWKSPVHKIIPLFEEVEMRRRKLGGQ